jgi:hypothetical protein
MGRVFAAVDLRERLILKLAGIAGMRPGGDLRSEVGEPGTALCGDPATGLPRRYRLSEIAKVDS